MTKKNIAVTKIIITLITLTILALSEGYHL